MSCCDDILVALRSVTSLTVRQPERRRLSIGWRECVCRGPLCRLLNINMTLARTASFPSLSLFSLLNAGYCWLDAVADSASEAGVRRRPVSSIHWQWLDIGKSTGQLVSTTHCCWHSFWLAASVVFDNRVVLRMGYYWFTKSEFIDLIIQSV